MLKINSTIIYGSEICKVGEIKEMTFGKTARSYYVLFPIYNDKNIIYVPTDNPKLTEKIKQILSPEEIGRLINSMTVSEPCWIDDDKERAESYKQILTSGKREDIVRIIKTLYEKKMSLALEGKKLHTADATFFERAEKMIYDEFALVLNIKREEVVPFILKQIQVDAKG